jgi:hypothetical protein
MKTLHQEAIDLIENLYHGMWSFDDGEEVCIPNDLGTKIEELRAQLKAANIIDHHKCMKCEEYTHIDDLDGKDDGSGNFTILHCAKCYGPGYTSNRT